MGLCCVVCHCPSCGPIAGVGRCVGSTLGCASRGGFTVCLHTLFSAGHTGAGTSDVRALGSRRRTPVS